MLADYTNCRAFGFAEPLKEAALAMFGDLGIDREDLYGPSERREKQIGGLVRADGEPLTLRYVLQTIGTEWGRETINNDIWVNLGLARARRYLSNGYNLVIITDVRFPNEINAINDAGGLVWWIDRPSARPDDENLHASEAEMLTHTFREQIGHIVDNTADLWELRRGVEAAYASSICPRKKKFK